MCLGGMVFHIFTMARCKIWHRKAAVVGKLGILFWKLPVTVPLVDAGDVGSDPPRRCTSILAKGIGLSRSSAGMGAASADQKGWSSVKASSKKLFMPQ